MNEPKEKATDTIVAEICVNWEEAEGIGLENKKLLSQRFETIIQTNSLRGYRLDSWQFTSVVTHWPDGPMLTETIIAVFKRQ